MLRVLVTGLLCLALGAAGSAAAAAGDDAAEQAADRLVASLHPQSGKINLPGAIATLDLPASFRYLDPDDSARLLQGWGNPPGAHTLGMIVPADINPMTAAGWGVVVTYDKDGHVKDDDADGIDYGKLLKDIQSGIEERNEERKKEGYPGMHLVGWAEPPHYDKANHKLYWAKELQNDDSARHGLNYNIRVLGREGVLVLNAVADMGQLGQIKNEMQQVTAFTNFTDGNRYADFNGATDKVAEYGIAALVAGGVAAKLGLFAKLFALLLAFKKLIVVGVAAAGSTIWKFFKRTPKASHAVPAIDPEATAKVDLNKY
jgi:uncharacterized membrane-anchored protein